jgi:hypothetical protein
MHSEDGRVACRSLSKTFLRESDTPEETMVKPFCSFFLSLSLDRRAARDERKMRGRWSCWRDGHTSRRLESCSEADFSPLPHPPASTSASASGAPKSVSHTILSFVVIVVVCFTSKLFFYYFIIYRNSNQPGHCGGRSMTAAAAKDVAPTDDMR